MMPKAVASHPLTLARKTLAGLDAILDAMIRVLAILVLPLALLLFLQWPLRDVVHAYSVEANDFAQIIFALYIGVAITAATRQNSHIASDALARRYSERSRRTLRRVAALVVLVPWSAFMVWAAWPPALDSIRHLERFSETFNPGYFIIRSVIVLLAIAILIQGLIDAFRRNPGKDRRAE
jgi:TRAP-type mannitol/chloroaromatic compound transport system permease small subunit